MGRISWDAWRWGVLTALVGAMLVTATGSVLGESRTGRVAGFNRIATAQEIAWRSFPGGADTVYVARGDVFADALVAGVLTDGPILLAEPGCDGYSDIRFAVEELDPSRVVALGGPAAVCDEELADAAAGRPTSRLAGATRYQTAVEIAHAAFPDEAATVYLANGADSPDAVAGGALTDGPILLVPPSGTVSDQLKQAVASFDPARVVALGGEAVLQGDALEAAAGGRSTDRLAGADRFETSVEIARAAFPGTPDVVYLARGDLFADAVAAGSLTDGPVVLVPSEGELPVAVARFLSSRTCRVVALGGRAAVSTAVLFGAADLACENPAPPPSDTYEVLYAEGRELWRYDERLIDPDTDEPFWQYRDIAGGRRLDIPPGRNELWTLEFELPDLEVARDPQLVVRDLDTLATTASYALRFSESGESSVPDQIEVSPDGRYVGVAFSPDDQFDIPAEFAVVDPVSGEVLLWLTQYINDFAMLPDGDVVMLEYESDDEPDRGRIVRIDAESYGRGTGLDPAVTVLQTFDRDLPLSLAVDRSGEQLAYVSGGGVWLTTMDPGAPARQVAGPDITQPVYFSPDGAMLAVVRALSEFRTKHRVEPKSHQYLIPADPASPLDLAGPDGEQYLLSQPGDGKDGETVLRIIGWETVPAER